MVESCQKNIQRGLACKLTNVCIKQSTAMPEMKWNIPRSEITLEDEKLGSGNFGSVYKGLLFKCAKQNPGFFMFMLNLFSIQ